MGTEYQAPTDQSSLLKANQIRVRVRNNDVPRWNRILQKSGKQNNTDLLEWMLHLAEEKLCLDPNQSRQEWDEALQRKTDLLNGFDDSDPGEQESHKVAEIGCEDEARPALENSGDAFSPSEENVHNGTVSPVMDASETIPGNSHPQRGPEQREPEQRDSNDCLRNEIARRVQDLASVEKTISVPGLLDEQITVEKKGSNAPIRKRFRLRVSSSAASTSEATIEGTPQTFREPLKVRSKLKKNEVKAISPSVQTAPKKLMTLRSREKTAVAPPTVVQSKAKKISKNKTTVAVEKDSAENAADIPQPEKSKANKTAVNSTEPAPSRPVTRLSRKQEVKGQKQKEGPFTCTHCPRVFNNATSHSRHERAHKRQVDHICSYCNKKFSTSGSLWHHKKSQHEEKHFKCSQCDQRFAVERFLKLHMRKHTGEKPYKCKVCGSDFALASTLRNHEGTHSAVKPFLCDTCGVSFRRKDNLVHHIERRHSKSRQYSCDQCGKTFSILSSLENHKIHHQNKQSGLTPFECNLCEKTFTNPNGLKSHMSLHKIRRDHICETCGKVFKMRYYLTKHQAIHLKVKPFLCNICDRRFAQKSNLDIHMRTHTGAKPYMCTVCNRSYAHNVSLKGHMLSCHVEPGLGNTTKTKAKKAPHSTTDEADPAKERQRKKRKKSPVPTLNNSVPQFGATDDNNMNGNDNMGGEAVVVNPATEEEGVRVLKEMAGSDPFVERGVMEDTMEADKLPDSQANLVIDEQGAHYNQVEESSMSPDFQSSLSAGGQVTAIQDGMPIVVGIPGETHYNIPGLMSTNQTSEKGQYIIPSSSMVREVPQSLPTNRHEHSISHVVEQVPPSTPPIHQHLEQTDIRSVGYSGVPHLLLHNHQANLGTYARHGHPLPLGSPPLAQQTGSASPIVHSQQEDNLTSRMVEIHPSVGAGLSQPLPSVSPHENLSPQQMVTQNDSASPLPPNLQVENTIHQQQPPFSQSINFIPTFHHQPQPLTITGQSTPLLPNMIRKEQPLLVDGLSQNYAAMIPFHAITPETAAQMVQDPRLQSANLQTTSQPVHLPFRYIEYAQTSVQGSQSPHIRSESLPPSGHFSKSQANLPASRMSSSLQQSFGYNVNMEQARGTLSYCAQGQRSPIFTNSHQIESVKEVNDEPLSQGVVEGGWKQQEMRWEHLHQIQMGQTLGRDLPNLPAQLHRQLLTEYTRKGPLHSTGPSTSQPPVWEPTNS